MKLTWKHERTKLLSAWPQRLAIGGDVKTPDIAAMLADTAIACADEMEWDEWKKTIERHWPSKDPSARISLASHLGASLADALAYLVDPEISTGSEWTFFISEDSGMGGYGTLERTVIEQAQQLCNQFNLASIYFSSSLFPNAKQKIANLKMALSAFAMATSQENHDIGRGELHLLLTAGNSVAIVSNNTMELPEDGQNLAGGWCQWILEKNLSALNKNDMEMSWTRSIRSGDRGEIERQRIFLEMTQNSLRQLAGSLVDRSLAGSLALRRYRAASKWIEDSSQGLKQMDILMKGWRKVKTGNRIAWTGVTGVSDPTDNQLRATIENWQWEDRVLEAAFWRAPQWEVPAWFQRYLALGAETWPENMILVRDERLLHAWTFAFEGMIRKRIGYDSAVAKSRNSHPRGFEANQMEHFLINHIEPHLYTDNT